MSVRVRNRGYSLLDRSEPTTASRRGGSLPVGGVAADAPGIVVRTLGPVLRPVRASLPNLFGQNGQDQSLEPNTFLLEQPRVASPAGGMTTNYDADAAATATYPARTSGVSAARSSRSKSSGMRERPSRLAAVLGVSTDDEHHDQHLVDNLDVIDGHVSVVSGLTNAANSILVPPLPFYNRAPVVDLQSVAHNDVSSLAVKQAPSQECVEKQSEMHEIDKHVAEVLSHRAALRRQLHGLWAFLKTPTGAVMGIYGFLVAFWGAGIVLFLGKLINLHNSDKQGLWVEITCQVENALFTITGVGLIPWRAIDTYRIARIWHYKRLIRKRRQQRGLPPLGDENDLPDPELDPGHIDVLEPRQREQLQRQQVEFAKSQTWYRPHRTDTHKAFPIATALWICLLVDGNSVFQCLLCGCMWGMNRFTRPAWTTGLLVPASFLCGIAAGVLIWRAGKQTKKTLEVEERLRQALERTDGNTDDAASDCEPQDPKIQVETKRPPSAAHVAADYDEEAGLQSRLVQSVPASAVSLADPSPTLVPVDQHELSR